MDVRLALTGFGNVGQGVATLLRDHGDEYQQRYGVRLMLTGVTDRGGMVIDPAGLDPASLLQIKREAGTVAAHPQRRSGQTPRQFLAESNAHVLVEAASTNFDDAEPGWSYARAALDTGRDVVFASKGSLVLHFGEIMAMAAQRGSTVLFGATVGAPVPVLELAERVLIGSRILGFEGVVNGTANQILFAMREGADYDEGVRQAQEMGIAETDPTLDVDGWDAAAKAVIIANAVLGANLRLSDVQREGIRGVTAEDQRRARERDEAIKLVARATVTDGKVQAEVRPEARPLRDILGRLRGAEMGILFHTEPLGDLAATHEDSGGQTGGILTAMTILRDVFNLAGDRGWCA